MLKAVNGLAKGLERSQQNACERCCRQVRNISINSGIAQGLRATGRVKKNPLHRAKKPVVCRGLTKRMTSDLVLEIVQDLDWQEVFGTTMSRTVVRAGLWNRIIAPSEGTPQARAVDTKIATPMLRRRLMKLPRKLQRAEHT
ncbi:hypothetical protein MRB53_041872 [Persea americana]|nr:hypothetical protein MRB53_041872 [Persea americana]